jgi:hypothetical protein
MISTEPTIIELGMDELKEILRRAEAKQFNDKDYETTRTVFQSYVQLLDLLKSKNVAGCSPRASYRLGKATRSPCFSVGGNMPAKTSRTCCRIG